VAPDSEFKWKRVELPKIWIVEQDRIPTKRELREVLNHANLEDRVIALVAASSGVREGTLAKLSVEDVDFNSYSDVAVVTVKPEVSKGKVGHVTFITPEARNVLLQYLNLRKRRGEVLTEKSPLLRSRTGNCYTPTGIRIRWLRLLKNADKAERERKYFSLHFHTLRKFFRTSLELAGVSKAFTERFLGHKPYLDQAYFKPQLDMLLTEYRKAIPHLTIVEQAAEYEEMRKKQLIDTARLLGFGDERIRRLEEVLARAKNVDEAIEEFKKLREEPGDPPKPNSVKIVRGEKELIKHLEQGWLLIKELNHDKYVVTS